MPREALESKLFGVLNETVAQGIFRELEDLKAHSETHGKRWIMELIQNALDVSKENGVDVQIEFNGKTILFSHNGRSFTEDELIHLIYHGSTKADSEGLSGKLGTGFLATHLLSMEVSVKGVLGDNESFMLRLDRDAGSVEELTAKMIKSWKELQIQPVDSNPQACTVYEYILDSAEKIEIYQKGISLLKGYASILLSLDKRLNSISIKDDHDELVWNKATNPESPLIEINMIHNKQHEESEICSVVLVSNIDTTVAVPLTRKDNGELAILNAAHLQKLYYPLPLIGSSAFPFPFLISNRNFEPTPDREGAFLTNATNLKSVTDNKKIVQIAFDLFPKVIDLLCKSGYNDLHNIAILPKYEDVQTKYSQWLDKDWIEPMVMVMIEKIRDSQVLLTSAGLKQPKNSRIPFLIGCADDTDNNTLTKLWELSGKLFQTNVPSKESYQSWQQILFEWATHYIPVNRGPEPYAESLTIEKLCNIIEEKSNVDFLQTSLGEAPVINWLNEFLALIQVTKKNSLFDNKRILPNQNKSFQTRIGMYRDAGISEDLKGIIQMLGRDARSELLLHGVIDGILVNSRSEQEILLDALKRIKNQASTDYQQEKYQKANVKLLQWLINNKLFDEIRNSYPIFSRGKDLNEPQYVYTFSSESLFLTPESIWEADDRKYIDIFDSRAVLSNIYADFSFEQWNGLAENNLIYQKLFFKRDVPLNNREIRTLSVSEIDENDGKEHKTIEKISATFLPFLENKDWGVADKITGKERATNFLSFLLSNLIRKDVSWKEEKTISCSCGSAHQIHPSLWLEALRTRQWVPVKGGKGEKPSSENLAPLFATVDLKSLLESDDVRYFLGILGVTVSVLLTANKSKEDRQEFDQAFSKLLSATDMNPEHLDKLANACADRDLQKKLLEAAAEKELIKTNQKIGEIVETIIRNLIETKLSKDIYKVEKVRTGSDAKIIFFGDVESENDFIDDEGKEIFVKITSGEIVHFIEIKSVRTDYARMTIPQAKQANNTSTAFTLCVVEVTAEIAQMPEEKAKKEVAQSARFVSPFGVDLDKMITEVEAFQRGEKQLSNQYNRDMQVDVVSEAKIRIRVNQDVWRNGLNIDDFIQFIGSNR